MSGKVTEASASHVKNDFGEGSIPKAIMRLAVPLAVAQIINVCYNLVDRMYIGRIPGVGVTALTGLGICLPIISMVTAFTNLWGAGGAPLCSIARGRGDIKDAEKTMNNAFFMLIVCGIILTTVFLILKKPLLYMFGASDDTFYYANSYLRIYLLGSTFVMISTGMNYFINSQGFGKTGMITVALGAVMNIILDPIFIFALKMGAAGAAFATIISQFCSSLWVLSFLTSKRAILRLRISDMKPEKKRVLRIASLGLANFCFALTNSLIQAVSNTTLQLFGGDLYVGVMTVVNSLREVLMMAVQGVTQGAAPVVSFNYGAKKYSRVNEGIRTVAAYSFIYCIVITFIILVFPGTLISIFNNDAALIEAGKPCLRIFFCAFICSAMLMTGQSSFTSLGMAKYAMLFSITRKVVIVTPLMVILPRIGLGTSGVFWSEPISEVLAGLGCIITMYFTVYLPFKRMKDGEEDKSKARKVK